MNPSYQTFLKKGWAKMKLNVDILIENLSDITSFKQYGQGKKQLHLLRPLLYDGKSDFKADHIYVTSVEYLPENPVFEKGSVVICKGEELEESYYFKNCVFIIVKTTKNIFGLFNSIQKIFDKYDEWNNSMQEIVMQRGEFGALLDVSKDIFQNPLFILGHNIREVSDPDICNDDCKSGRELNNTIEEAFSNISHCKETTEKKHIYLYAKSEYNILCLNLFQESQFIGGIYIIDAYIRPFRASDQALLQHLKNYVDSLLTQYYKIISVDNNVSKKIFRKILNEDILKEPKLLREIKSSSHKEDRFICIEFRLEGIMEVVPANTVCKQIEEKLPGTVAVVHDKTIVSFMNLRYSSNHSLNGSDLINFLQINGFKAGVSEEFNNVLQAKYYFLEARAAIDLGYPYNPELEIYYFEDYIKEYILSMITSEIPAELICEKGLLRLLEHDQCYHTSYYHELRTYLNCNMNAVQASKKLYIHRNTLLSHLAEIYKLINIDLEDPEERMYIQLSYKLLEGEENL